LKRDTVSSRS
jgi:hypothetical protein